MPAFELMDRIHDAVLWPKTGNNELGQHVVGSPVNLLVSAKNGVQWDDHQTEMLDPKGNVIQVEATVFANRVITIGSVMRKGAFAEWAGTGSVIHPSRLMEVKAVNITDDLKGRNKVYFYGLVRFTDTLPVT